MPVISQANIFNGRPKHWHHDVVQFIHNQNKMHSSQNGIITIFSMLSHSSRQFINFGHKTLLVETKTKFWNDSMESDDFVKCKDPQNILELILPFPLPDILCLPLRNVSREYGYKFVKAASGKLLYIQQAHNVDQLTHQILFKVDPFLRVNLTFVGIFFNGVFGKICYNAGVVVFDFPMNQYLFCKRYSMFSLFFILRNISVLVRKAVKSNIEVHGYFSVMDNQVLRTQFEDIQVQHRSTKYATEIFLQSQIEDIRSIEMIFKSFYFQTRKNYCFFLLFSKDLIGKYIFYDGPGVLSPKTTVGNNKGNRFYKTATFQFLLHTWKPIWGQICQFQTTSIKPSLLQIVSETDTSKYTLPNSFCSQFWCFLQISATFGFQVNATLFSLSFVGPSSDTCQYGGIMANEILADVWFETNEPVCSSFNVSQLKGKNLYSTNSSLNVMLYWYVPYSTINVSLSFSATRCKPVFLDPCTYQRACVLRWKFHTCSSFLEKATQYSGISFERKDHAGNQDLEVSLKDMQCAILRVSPRKTIQTEMQTADSLIYHTCSVSFVGNAENLSDRYEMIPTDYEIKGELTSFPRKVRNTSNDCIDIFGGTFNPEDFDKFHSDKPHILTNCMNGTFHVSFRKPGTSSTKIYIRLHGNSAGFVDIILSKHKGIKDQKQTQPQIITFGNVLEPENISPVNMERKYVLALKAIVSHKNNTVNLSKHSNVNIEIKSDQGSPFCKHVRDTGLPAVEKVAPGTYGLESEYFYHENFAEELMRDFKNYTLLYSKNSHESSNKDHLYPYNPHMLWPLYFQLAPRWVRNCVSVKCFCLFSLSLCLLIRAKF